MTMNLKEVKQQLKMQKLETPSWGYADSGTRFHVFKQKSAAHTLEEKLEDAAEVQRYTGICPTVALHIPWDNVQNWEKAVEFAKGLGLKIGAINPNLFQDEEYKLGSLCHPYGGTQCKRRGSVNRVHEGRSGSSKRQ